MLCVKTPFRKQKSSFWLNVPKILQNYQHPVPRLCNTSKFVSIIFTQVCIAASESPKQSISVCDTVSGNKPTLLSAKIKCDVRLQQLIILIIK